jgi:hypothetical protein
MKLSMMEGETTTNEAKNEPRLKGRGPRVKGRQLYVFERLNETWPMAMDRLGKTSHQPVATCNTAVTVRGSSAGVDFLNRDRNRETRDLIATVIPVPVLKPTWPEVNR